MFVYSGLLLLVGMLGVLHLRGTARRLVRARP